MARWRSPVALKAITDMATDREAPSSLRRAAITVMQRVTIAPDIVCNPDRMIAEAVATLKKDRSRLIQALVKDM